MWSQHCNKQKEAEHRKTMKRSRLSVISSASWPSKEWLQRNQTTENNETIRQSWKETTKKTNIEKKRNKTPQAPKQRWMIKLQRRKEFKNRPRPKPPKTHNDTLKNILFSPAFWAPRCTESQVVHQVKHFPWKSEFTNYLCFFIHDSGLCLQNPRQTHGRKLHKLSGKCKKENTNRDTTQIQLECQMPKILLKPFFCFSCLVPLPFSSFFHFDEARLLWGINIDIHRQKQSIKS